MTEGSDELRNARAAEIAAGRVLGAGVAACSLLWNPWTFDWLLGSGTLEHPGLRRVVLGIGILLLVVGTAMMRQGGRVAARFGLLVFTVFLIFPLAAEGLIRVGIRVEHPQLYDPALFADPLADDDNWKLWFRWSTKPQIQQAPTVDAELGWAPRVTRPNPLGVHRETPYEVDRAARAVLFHGDSFVHGTTALPDRIPQRLEKELAGPPVYNYGVGGYGVGQVYLRMLRSLESFDDPVVLFGIFTMDLDRTILSVRSGPKPRFRLGRDDELIIEGGPFEMDPREWFESHPPSIRSFGASFLAQWNRKRAAEGQWTESRYRRDTKMAVNEKILDLARAAAAERDVPILFVMFVPKSRLGNPGWRERFLARFMGERNQPWIDTSVVLLEAARRSGKDARDFYGDDGHPNAEGNAILARAIAGRFAKGFGTGP